MQEQVNDFIDKYCLHINEQIRYIDLVSEIGELGKEIIKGTDYGKQEYAPTSDINGELGDCLFSLFALCCEMDVDAQEVLQQALSKYEERFRQKGSIGSE